MAESEAGSESSSDWPWPGVKKCCVAGQGDGSVRCDADAVYLAQGSNGRTQWFVCGDESHWVDVRLLVPLSHWYARLEAVFAADEAHHALTGVAMTPQPDWRTIEVEGLPPLSSVIVEVGAQRKRTAV